MRNFRIWAKYKHFEAIKIEIGIVFLSPFVENSFLFGKMDFRRLNIWAKHLRIRPRLLQG
jgi:hypothetical protein